MESFWVLGFLMLRSQNDSIQLNALLIWWILGPNIIISEMVVVLGGFSSVYYIGLNLMFLGAAVVAPVSWKSHLIGQLTSLLYYLGVNIFRSRGVINLADVSLNLTILIWMCIALLVSVFLYERLHRAEFEARIKLLELDRLKSEFFANVSHELRTPLTLTLGAFKALKEISLDSKVQELVQLGLRNGSRLLFLINELLDLAKFDSGKTKLEKRFFDLSDLVRGVGASFQSSKGRRIHYRGLSSPRTHGRRPSSTKKGHL